MSHLDDLERQSPRALSHRVILRDGLQDSLDDISGNLKEIATSPSSRLRQLSTISSRPELTTLRQAYSLGDCD
jgi:hypothetical protein